jgi:hypothetical protein
VKNEKCKDGCSPGAGSASGAVEKRKLEQKHRRGYLRKPVSKTEFTLWDKEQKWGDE